MHNGTRWSISRRTLLRALGGSAAAYTSSELRAAPARFAPKIGAIRWDAWYKGREDTANAAVTRSLAIPQFWDRLPFFAERDGNDWRIDGTRPGIIEQEIGFAKQAGLSFWAFVAYPPDRAMSAALHLYLRSEQRAEIDFCLLAQADFLGRNDAPNPALDFHVDLVREPGYFKVQGRPVYLLGFVSPRLLRDAWGGISNFRGALNAFRRRLARSAGAEPYLVILDFTPARAAQLAADLGADAISSYAVNNNRAAGSYADLAREARELWVAQSATGAKVIPIITSGYDERPRVMTPPPWYRRPVDMERSLKIYYEAPTAEQLQDHVADCMNWMQANESACWSGVALAYAWNEHDEGGWIQPTYPGNSTRVEAFRRALVSRASKEVR